MYLFIFRTEEKGVKTF